MKRLSALLALFALIVAGCGGGGGSSAGLPAGVQPGFAAGSATLVIPNSATTTSATGRRPQFISVSATSVKISVATLADQIFSIAAGSTNCTTANNARTCTLAFTATAGQPAITVTLYDGANATGNVLGSASATPSVSPGVPFTVSLSIGGTIKTVTINLSSAFTMGTAGSATVTVTAVDADGNTISGTGNFSQPVTLINTDTSGALTLSGTTIASPTGSVTLTYNGATLTGTPMINGSVPLSGVQVNSASVFSSSPSPSFCTLSNPIPGTYTSIFSFGTVSGTTYTATIGSNLSDWDTFSYAAATPAPSPTATATSTAAPTATPSPTRTPQPVYLYEGMYQLQSGTNGCFDVVTSQDGSPLSIESSPPEQGSSGFGTGTPNFNAQPFTSTFVGFGPLTSLVVSNLSATGGSGTVGLSNGDSGTVTMTGRFPTTLDQVRKLQAQRRRH